jgi:hypothetical protein
MGRNAVGQTGKWTDRPMGREAFFYNSLLLMLVKKKKRA